MFNLITSLITITSHLDINRLVIIIISYLYGILYIYINMIILTTTLFYNRLSSNNGIPIISNKFAL